MIAFVENGNIKDIIPNINLRLEKKEIDTLEYIKDYFIIENCNFSYKSIHKCLDNKQIDLYHLFFDYNNIITK